jgi:hypothetical protein
VVDAVRLNRSPEVKFPVGRENHREYRRHWPLWRSSADELRPAIRGGRRNSLQRGAANCFVAKREFETASREGVEWERGPAESPIQRAHKRRAPWQVAGALCSRLPLAARVASVAFRFGPAWVNVFGNSLASHQNHLFLADVIT